MKPPNRIILMLSGIAVTTLLTGCFSSQNENMRTPTRGIEAPSVSVPSQTAAIENEDGLPQRQRMLIYLDPWILGSR